MKVPKLPTLASRNAVSVSVYEVGNPATPTCTLDACETVMSELAEVLETQEPPYIIRYHGGDGKVVYERKCVESSAEKRERDPLVVTNQALSATVGSLAGLFREQCAVSTNMMKAQHELALSQLASNNMLAENMKLNVINALELSATAREQGSSGLDASTAQLFEILAPHLPTILPALAMGLAPLLTKLADFIPSPEKKLEAPKDAPKLPGKEAP